MGIIQQQPDSTYGQGLEQIKKEQYIKELTLVKSNMRTPGHSLFSYNTVTGEWKKVNLFTSKDLGTNGSAMTASKVIMEPDCIYIQALNLKNAIKKFNKLNNR